VDVHVPQTGDEVIPFAVHDLGPLRHLDVAGLPTAVIRSPVTTTVMLGLAGVPVASMTVTPVMASALAGASSARAGSAAARATTVRQAVTCLIGLSGGCGEVGKNHDTTSGGAPTIRNRI
jgi:hypothetical protein